MASNKVLLAAITARLSARSNGAAAEARSQRKLRLAAMALYGQRCACNCGCGETSFSALDFDHIDNNGGIQRTLYKSSHAEVLARTSNGVPPSDMRVLCKNCNGSRNQMGRTFGVTECEKYLIKEVPELWDLLK